jgi:glyoxylase-like metal-dependent hydrolase (beta-lactamase superfamily II)
MLNNVSIIQHGDASGNGMVAKIRLRSGLDIFTLPTKNFYGGHWDLGPTWNYAVMADRPFLVDAGRFGQGRHLVDMMDTAGIKPGGLEFVLISHSHEDHDGGLAELVALAECRVKAHTVYDLLIRQYPALAPKGYKQAFPAKCWHCIMPASFFEKNCLGYHRVLQNLEVDCIGDAPEKIDEEISTIHLPGHSPDSLAVVLGSEAMIVGDVVLPDITPWPTRLAQYDEIADVLTPMYPQAGALFGLDCYLDSLAKLKRIVDRTPDILVLPAHRLYYNDQWNGIQLSERLDQLVAHHIQRCGAILDILATGTKAVDEVVQRHFKASLLEGPGQQMAANEIVSHAELLQACGDLEVVDTHRYAATGSRHFEQHIAGKS